MCDIVVSFVQSTILLSGCSDEHARGYASLDIVPPPIVPLTQRAIVGRLLWQLPIPGDFVVKVRCHWAPILADIDTGAPTNGDRLRGVGEVQERSKCNSFHYFQWSVRKRTFVRSFVRSFDLELNASQNASAGRPLLAVNRTSAYKTHDRITAANSNVTSVPTLCFVPMQCGAVQLSSILFTLKLPALQFHPFFPNEG